MAESFYRSKDSDATGWSWPVVGFGPILHKDKDGEYRSKVDGGAAS